MIARRTAILGLLATAGCDPVLDRTLGANPARPPRPNEPSVVDGRRFVPIDQPGYDATGRAAIFQRAGGTNALRESNPRDLPVAAHPTLILPAIVRVTNLENGRQATIRVNDRGPFTPDALIGLAPGAMAQLGAPGTLLQPGPGVRVRVTLLAAETAAARAAYAARERDGRHMGYEDMPPLP